jgi:transcriptional regulator with XRE-family HTH domain
MAVAGARFESYVKEAMREAEIPSLAELSRRSGIAVSAWHGWFRGERQPRRNSLVLAGSALSRTPEQLAATWEGTKPHKPLGRPQGGDDVAEAIRAQTEAMLLLVEELRQTREEQVGMNEGLVAVAAQVAKVIEAREGNG